MTLIGLHAYNPSLFYGKLYLIIYIFLIFKCQASLVSLFKTFLFSGLIVLYYRPQGFEFLLHEYDAHSLWSILMIHRIFDYIVPALVITITMFLLNLDF